ncbi:hypothetical protein SprV_0501984500 [Sparganum proliferum]
MSASCPDRCLFGRPRVEDAATSTRIASEMEEACRKTMFSFRRRFNFDLEEMRPTKVVGAGKPVALNELQWNWEVLEVSSPSKSPIPAFYSSRGRSITVKRMQPSGLSQCREAPSRIEANDTRENSAKPRITQTKITDTWQVRIRRGSGVRESDREAPCKPLSETKSQDVRVRAKEGCGSPGIGSKLRCRTV